MLVMSDVKEYYLLCVMKLLRPKLYKHLDYIGLFVNNLRDFDGPAIILTLLLCYWTCVTIKCSWHFKLGVVFGA
jgi:hypothetical protein